MAGPRTEPGEATPARWLGRGVSAVAAQVIQSGTSFVASVLLARWLEPAAFGAFTVATTVLLLIATIYGDVVLEPIAYFATSAYGDRRRAYLEALRRWQLGLAAGAAVACALAAAVVGLWSSEIAWALAALAAIVPAIALGWLARRTSLALGRTHHLAVLELFAAAIFVAALLGLLRAHLLGPARALAAQGAAQGLFGVLLWRSVTRGLDAASGDPVARAAVAREHWSYGRWTLASLVLSWIATDAVVLLLPRLEGIGAAAAFRANATLCSPPVLATAAISPLLVVRLLRQGDGRASRSLAFAATAALGAGAASFGALVHLGRADLARVVFGGRYADTAELLAGFAALSTLRAVRSPLAAAVLAFRGPRAVAAADAVAAAIALPAALALRVPFGLAGVLTGLCAGQLAAVAVLASRTYSGAEIR